jgi:6-bladed beta-propeller
LGSRPGGARARAICWTAPSTLGAGRPGTPPRGPREPGFDFLTDFFSGGELTSEAKAAAGARTRDLIQEAQRLPLIAREFLVEPPQPGWELGMVSWAALDRSGVLYMIQRGDRADPVIAVDMLGHVLRSWGRGQYEIPHAIRIDPAGNIWTVDAATSVLHKFTPHGEILQQINVGGQPTGAQSRFNGATDVAFGPDGRIFVADGYGNARILEYRSDGKKVREWGSAGIGPGQFHLPHSIVIDGETLYVADRENGRIQLFDLDGKHLDEFSIGKTYSLQVAGGSLWASMHPLDQPTASPGWLVKLDKGTRKILGYVQVAERRGLHFVEATEQGEPMTGVANQVRWYRSNAGG